MDRTNRVDIRYMFMLILWIYINYYTDFTTFTMSPIEMTPIGNIKIIYLKYLVSVYN